MATLNGNPGQIISLAATEDITQGQLLKAATGGVAKTSAATSAVVGFAANSADNGKQVDVVLNGTVYAEATAAIAVGAFVQPAADGKITTASGTNPKVAIALQAAAAAGDKILVKLI